MQLHEIAHSLKEIASENPMAAAIAALGFAGNIHYGVRAARGAERAFGLLTIVEVGRDENGTCSGTAEVEYEVTLQVVCDELIEQAARILEMFHRYWDRITSLPSLPLDSSGLPLADFISIFAGDATDVGETDNPELGGDVILGTTSWTLTLSEYKPEL